MEVYTMQNIYTLEVYKKQEKPCFVVTIQHCMLSGVYFFNTLEEANEHINYKKAVLEPFATLYYDENGNKDDGYANVIKLVLSCENIQIGENGGTYYKEK